jgi:hypothetical protein
MRLHWLMLVILLGMLFPSTTALVPQPSVTVSFVQAAP